MTSVDHLTVADFHAALVRRQLDWIRFVEQFDEESAQLILGRRLQADAKRAGADVMLPERWPSQPENVARMMRRGGERVRFDRVSEMMRDGDRVLDIGCGHGVVAACIARRRRLGAYYGVDLNPGNVASAREMADVNSLEKTLSFEVADATKLDTATMSGLNPNVALFLEVLEHLDDPTAALRAVGDALPDQTLIVFSVPLLGRIEACWGHRTIFGADAIQGLVGGADLMLQHVEEIHNTWALAVATRRREPHPEIGRFMPPGQASAFPRHITHVRLDRVTITGGSHELVAGPLRLTLRTEEEVSEISFPAAKATMLRIDLEIDDPRALHDIVVEIVDREGNVVSSWVGTGVTLVKRRSTLVFRPDWPVAGFTGGRNAAGTGDVARLRVRSAPRAQGTITIWRIGYSSSDTPDPVTHLARGVSRGSSGSVAIRAARRLREPRADESRTDAVRAVFDAASRDLANRARRLRGVLRRR